MGYETGYSLRVLKARFAVTEIAPTFVDITCTDEGLAVIDDLRSSNESAEYCLDFEGESEQAAKWCDHNLEMLDFSKKYPDLLFKLHGEGERNGDLWDKYYLNGKMQKCEAVIFYQDFDQNQLK
jgi:hypothetical protein